MTNKQPNILVFEPEKADSYAESIRSFGFTSIRSAKTEEEAKRYLPETEVILGWKFPTHLLSQPISSNVRWFQSMGAGINDLMADASIPERIKLTRIVDQFGTYISEYVFSFLLYIAKDFPRMRQAKIEREWDYFIADKLAGKKIGVAGLGSIGSEIVRKARAFDMKVSGLSFSGRNAHIVDEHYNNENWKEFVKDLDYLVLILPLTDETYHVINKKILLSMKPDACLVNVGRGSLIAEEDLLSVMDSGHLKAAVLDVFEKEPLPQEHPFYSMPNVYVTSHLSGPSTVEGVGQFFVENFRRYMNSEPLKGVVDRKRGY